MKNLAKFTLIIIGAALFSSSCTKKSFPSKTTAASNEDSAKSSNVVILTQEGLQSLGDDKYYNDAFLKANIWVLNSSDVNFNAANVDVKSDVVVNGQGGVKAKTEQVRSYGILPAGTAGQIDSIVRFDTKNISRFRVKYLIEDVGPYFIWYYRKGNEAGSNFHWYASNNDADLTINGIPFKRTTFNNRLNWDFTQSNTSSSKTFKVTSPFNKTVTEKNNSSSEEKEQK